MNILSYNPGHDGAIAYLKGAHLLVSIEAEKNSNFRYLPIFAHDLLVALGELEEIPDVLCTGGWWPRDEKLTEPPTARYRGVLKSDVILGQRRLLGKEVRSSLPPTSDPIFFALLACPACPLGPRAMH